MNPYLEFVKGIQDVVAKAAIYTSEIKTTPIQAGPAVLLFSPHPDDECITGLLPLRLMREAGKRIVNVPITFGSNVKRQAGRAKELQNACRYLGWEIYRPNDKLRPLAVADVVRALRLFQPELIFMPHANDWNSGHVATHALVVKALRRMRSDFSCDIVETEFWSAMNDPNLLVEGDAQLVADLVAATSLHVGEVARNPYHLLLPAWMQDNVRRGGELVAGEGAAAPNFSFATVYRLRRWERKGFVDIIAGGQAIPLGHISDRLEGVRQ